MKETLTLTVQKALQNELINKRVSPGFRIPTEMELAGAYRVSLTTVRRAIDGLVSNGLLIKKQGSGTYVAERHQVRQRTIGLVIPDMKFSPFYTQMAARLEPELRDRDYRTVLYVAEDLEGFHRSIHGEKKHFDGLIICGYLIRHQELRAEGVPYVIAGTESPTDADCVCFDLAAGAGHAVKHLIELGHRNILFFSNHSPPGVEHPRIQDMGVNLSNDLRYKGYRQTMEEEGIEVEPSWVFPAGPSRRQGYETMKRLLGEGRRNFTAVFAGNDMIADGAAQAMREAGIEIPKDVSLVGCDNIQDTADHLVSLTTIDLRLEDVAKRAIDLLLDRIEHSLTDEYRCISLVPKLVIRNTTGPAA
jgi:DNA-binding LacI/PurR family transcriptional regulator